MLSKRVWVAAIIAALAIVLAIVYYYFDPVEARWMPRCLWKVATGTDCPGCGSQRMVHALVHGDILGAWRANAFALCMIPLIILLISIEFLSDKYPKLYSKIHHPVVVISFGIAVIVWWILRNLINV